MNHPRRWFLRLALTGAGGLLLPACRDKTSTAAPAAGYFTCSMHPFVRSRVPGKCPVCGMDLIPVMPGQSSAPAASLTTSFSIPVERRQQIGVTYAKAQRRQLRRTLQSTGTVACDPKRAWLLVSHTDGFIKSLFVSAAGERVQAAQPLISISKSSEEVTLRSPASGIVREISASQGASVKAGDRLVEIADLSVVWVWADFYETDIGAIRAGAAAAVTVPGYPAGKFEGEITLIDPFLDETRRTLKARIEIANPDLKLLPGMYANVILDLPVEVALAIPVNAVLPTGTHNLVFVDKGDGKLEPRDVTLGAESDGFYEVKSGLKEGDTVIASAVFLIDAEAQIQGALKAFDSSEATR